MLPNRPSGAKGKNPRKQASRGLWKRQNLPKPNLRLSFTFRLGEGGLGFCPFIVFTYSPRVCEKIEI